MNRLFTITALGLVLGAISAYAQPAPIPVFGFGVSNATQAQTVGNSSTAINVGVNEVDLATNLTAARTYTLAAASSMRQGCVRFHDFTGSLTLTNTVTFAAAGSDTIDGAPATAAFLAPYLSLTFCSNGTNAWNILDTTIPSFSAPVGQFVNALNPNGSFGSATPSVSNSGITIANAGSTGTTVNKLAKLTGAPSTAVITATSDTSGALGIVTSGAGTTGSAYVQFSGSASCVFDGATTAGDYVQISSATAGDCTDAGATLPSTGQVVGQVLSTNGGAGTYAVAMNATGLTYTANSAAFTYQNGVSGKQITPAISTATFTPDLNLGNVFIINLTSACPCTIANPLNISSRIGSFGSFHVVQDGSGSRTIGTWGADYLAVGGVSTLVLSTAATATDIIPFEVTASGSIVLGTVIKNPSH